MSDHTPSNAAVDPTCPPWCTQEHDTTGEVDPHRSEGVLVPAIVLPEPTHPEGEPDLLVVQRLRPLDSAHDWITIESTEEAETQLTLSAETAVRLHQALSRSLGP